MEIFGYQYFVNALLASLLTAVSCGIIGSYIVSKRMVFVAGGITHSSFGGIGIAYYFGLNPILGASVFALLSGLGIERFTKKADIRNDSVIAILWSLGMAIGIIFIYLTPGYAPNLMSYLFGNILTVNSTDILFLFALSVVILLFFGFFFKKILFISFDEEFAKSQNIRVELFNYVLMILVALTIVLNIKIVGIILLISLLTVPQNTANLFTKNFKKIIFYSIIIAFLGSASGLIISYFLNIPSGATIIFNLILIYILIRIIKIIFKF
ncbi:MAG: metal ABC transporter permease [Bacteroidales bacterium]|nr:metal ABC transporter permease [Bacteroidales bacterium]MCF8389131.1 metal ABC transporter permease [Bacteroidales bacterium]